MLIVLGLSADFVDRDRKVRKALFSAGHHRPVFAVRSDTDEVGPVGEHDEAVTVGSEPGVVGRDWRAGAHEDVFAGPGVFESCHTGAVAG
jgi:hypothetical protein